MKELSQLIDFRYRVQNNRIREGNRLSAVDRGKSQVSDRARSIMLLWAEAHQDMEAGIESMLAEMLREGCPPIIEQMIELKGIGIITAAKIVSEIDITRCDTVSALWRYAGYGVVDGKRERYTRGEQAHFNRRLKIAVRLAIESFLKARSPYAEIYAITKQSWAAKYEGVIPPSAVTRGGDKYSPILHAHNVAIGKTAKVFLCHLWERWRRLEGLTTRDIYSIDKLKHEHYIMAERFGWPAM
jgi:hypothetical protein